MNIWLTNNLMWILQTDGANLQ